MTMISARSRQLVEEQPNLRIAGVTQTLYVNSSARRLDHLFQKLLEVFQARGRNDDGIAATTKVLCDAQQPSSDLSLSEKTKVLRSICTWPDFRVSSLTGGLDGIEDHVAGRYPYAEGWLFEFMKSPIAPEVNYLTPDNANLLLCSRAIFLLKGYSFFCRNLFERFSLPARIVFVVSDLRCRKHPHVGYW